MTSTASDRLTALKVELAALKAERKEQKKASKIQATWVAAAKRLPDSETLRAVVWANGQMERAWYSEGKWYAYDGTFFLTEKDKIEGVSHWMPIDWMTSRSWPMYGPGFLNSLRALWRRFSDGAQDMAYDLRPAGWGGTAQLGKKPVFYRDPSGKILSGMPENLPAPTGFQKIICNNVFEAERYSELQRRQERVEHGRQMEERGAIENQFRDEIRSEMRTKMANARNNLNRDFMRRALERNEGKGDPTRYERESFLHSEGFERGH